MIQFEPVMIQKGGLTIKNLPLAHLPTLFNHLPDGIFIADRTGKTLWMNTASTKQLGVSREYLIGKYAVDLEKEGIFSPSIIKDVRKTRKTVSKVQTSTGRQFIATGYLVEIPEEQTEYILVHVKDITETVKASLQLEKAEALVQQYVSEIKRMKAANEQAQENYIIGMSKPHQQLMKMLERVANVDATTLLMGETGVGKTAIAQKIHQASDRSEEPFIPINCSAIPENLLESELFGYTKGAFTGANPAGKNGLVEKANGGTLFLDEIAELPLILQAKILQLVQDKTYLPVGATTSKKADIRIITATNENLLQLVEEKRFREDLYYRLNVITVQIPPLRERAEDILPLAHHFFQVFSTKYNRTGQLSEELLQFFETYHWPGNVRELENLLERLVVTSQYPMITLQDLPSHLLEKIHVLDTKLPTADSINLSDYLSRVEKNLILQAASTHSSSRKAAQSLGLSQSSYLRRLHKYQ